MLEESMRGTDVCTGERMMNGLLLRYLVLVVCAVITAIPAAAIEPENVLVLWNSRRAESQAIRDAYVALYPGVHEFDLDNNGVGTASINRTNYTSLIRNPLRDFINGITTGDDISDQVICIVTTRGLPGRINGGDEMQLFSTWSSLESDLVLLQQDFDLTQGTSAFLPTRDAGPIDNPWHFSLSSGQPATSFSRATVKDPLNWIAVNGPGGVQSFRVQGLDPGDIYLVCRLDAAPTDEGMPEEVTAVEHTLAMLDRAQNLRVGQCDVQVLFDEFGNPNQLDDDGLSPLYLARDDFELAAAAMTADGWAVLHDETNNWVEQSELPDPAKPLIVFGTYGENHDVFAGDDPPGDGEYVYDYLYHPGCIFVSYESFNGDSIVTGNRRQNQAQALEFISAGGTFAVPTIKEPFTFTQTDLEPLTQYFFAEGFTFAEAAYMSIPSLSWQSTPIGDPLVRVTVYPTTDPDINGDDLVDANDLYAHFALPSDLNCDGMINAQDAVDLRNGIRQSEPGDVAAR